MNRCQSCKKSVLDSVKMMQVSAAIKAAADTRTVRRQWLGIFHMPLILNIHGFQPSSAVFAETRGGLSETVQSPAPGISCGERAIKEFITHLSTSNNRRRMADTESMHGKF